MRRRAPTPSFPRRRHNQLVTEQQKHNAKASEVYMDTLNKATLDGSNPIDLRHAALYPTAWTALPLGMSPLCA